MIKPHRKKVLLGSFHLNSHTSYFQRHNKQYHRNLIDDLKASQSEAKVSIRCKGHLIRWKMSWNASRTYKH